MKLLTREGSTVFFDSVDEDLTTYSWRVSIDGYAVKRVRGDAQSMHRLIMSRVLGRALLPTDIVDHADRRKLNNRRSNLRLVTRRQNATNRKRHKGSRTGFKGVIAVRYGLYGAHITVDYKRFHICHASDPAEAAWMRDQWALALHGDFAVLNFDYI